MSFQSINQKENLHHSDTNNRFICHHASNSNSQTCCAVVTSVCERSYLQPVAGISPGGHQGLGAGEPGILGHSIRQIEHLGLTRLWVRVRGKKEENGPFLLLVT